MDTLSRSPYPTPRQGSHSPMAIIPLPRRDPIRQDNHHTRQVLSRLPIRRLHKPITTVPIHNRVNHHTVALCRDHTPLQPIIVHSLWLILNRANRKVALCKDRTPLQPIIAHSLWLILNRVSPPFKAGKAIPNRVSPLSSR